AGREVLRCGFPPLSRTAPASAAPPSRTSEIPARRRGGRAGARPEAAGSEALALRPQRARGLGARWHGGSGRERGAARSRTYVPTTNAAFYSGRTGKTHEAPR